MLSSLCADLAPISAIGKRKQETDSHQSNCRTRALADPNRSLRRGMKVESSRGLYWLYLWRRVVRTILMGCCSRVISTFWAFLPAPSMSRARSNTRSTMYVCPPPRREV
jgi:hypothetical protein